MPKTAVFFILLSCCYWTLVTLAPMSAPIVALLATFLWRDFDAILHVRGATGHFGRLGSDCFFFFGRVHRPFEDYLPIVGDHLDVVRVRRQRLVVGDRLADVRGQVQIRLAVALLLGGGAGVLVALGVVRLHFGGFLRD